MASPRWLQENPNASVQHLVMEESDHLPILITTDEQNIRARRPCIFFKAWTMDLSCQQVVRRAQSEGSTPGMAWHKLGKSIWATTKALKLWNKNHFGYANIRIQSLEKELRKIQLLDGDNRLEQRRVTEELKIQGDHWESILKQKSREL